MISNRTFCLVNDELAVCVQRILLKVNSYKDKIFDVAGENTRWFKYDRDDLCVNKSQFVPVIFEPPCILAYR